MVYIDILFLRKFRFIAFMLYVSYMYKCKLYFIMLVFWEVGFKCKPTLSKLKDYSVELNPRIIKPEEHMFILQVGLS